MAIAKGTEQLGVGIDAALAGQFREFVKVRGETIREAVEMALRRHMANPPPLPDLVPLPPLTSTGGLAERPVPSPSPKKGKPKK